MLFDEVPVGIRDAVGMNPLVIGEIGPVTLTWLADVTVDNHVHDVNAFGPQSVC